MRWLWCLAVFGSQSWVMFGQALQGPSDRDLAMAVFNRVNQVGQSRQLPPLTYKEELAALAVAHTQKMAASGKLSHDGFSGRFDAAKRKIPGLSTMGENVAINCAQADVVADTVKSWMGSPVHRANIIREYTLTGVSVVRGVDGNYYFTQIFGK